MDYKFLSLIVTMEAQRRGAPLELAVRCGEEAARRVLEVPNQDLLGTIMIIEQEFSNCGVGRP